MDENKNFTKQKRQFLLIWIVFAVILFFRFFDNRVTVMNSTVLAFNYSYGFLSRGFIGSLYLLLDKLTPGSMYNYLMCLKFTQLMTGCYLLCLFLFTAYCVKKCQTDFLEHMEYLLLFFAICAVPIFATKYNFGRSDMYLVMITLLGAMLLMSEFAEWLLVPLTAVGIMIHQGYAFMFYNVLLVLLFYKWMSAKDSKKRKKYCGIFVSSLLVCLILFFWFEKFSHVDGQAVLTDVVKQAKALGLEGDYHKDVIRHEILGLDLTESEKPWHLMNLVQLPMAILLYLPFLWILFTFLKEILTDNKDLRSKLKYLAFAVGSFTMIPEFLLKVDYGRWVFALLCYYCVTIISLLTMGDEKVQQAWSNTIQKLKNKAKWLPVLLLAYALLLQPCLDVCINDITAQWSQYINQQVLHWWTSEKFTEIYY